MKHLIRLTDWAPQDFRDLFDLTDRLATATAKPLDGHTVVLFYPRDSIFTRSSSDRAVYLLGAQSLSLDNTGLERPEDPREFIGYLQNFASAMVVRHHNLDSVRSLASVSSIPIIVAMSNENHPVEVLSDTYQLSRMFPQEWQEFKYLFVGPAGGVSRGWLEASRAMGLNLMQCCPKGFEIPGAPARTDLSKAIVDADVIITAAPPIRHRAEFADYTITAELLEQAKPNVMLNPTPTYTRGDEVSESAMAGPWFVGYDFKKSMVTMMQALLLTCIGVPLGPELREPKAITR